MTRSVTIKTVLNGFVVKIGCQMVVFNSREALISHLDHYLAAEDPYKYEQTFVSTALNARRLDFEPNSPTAQNGASTADAAPPMREPRTLEDAFDTM